MTQEQAFQAATAVTAQILAARERNNGKPRDDDCIATDAATLLAATYGKLLRVTL